MNASSRLKAILGNRPEGKAGSAYIEKLSSDPLVGVGFVVGVELDLALVFPPGTLSQSVKMNRLVGKRNGVLSIHFGDDEAEALEADYLLFDQLSPAVATLLDAFTEALLIKDKSLAADLLTDFIDLFRPKNSLSDDEVVGLWGELVAMSCWSDLDLAVASWHDDPSGRYDFALSQDRLEVKTTLGSTRTHTFSSNQLPSVEGINLYVVSLLADTVHSATSVLDLWFELDNKISDSKLRKKLRDQVMTVVRRDPDKVGEMTFDRDLSQMSIRYFRAEDVPTLHLPSSIIKAKWECRIDEELAISSLTVFGKGEGKQSIVRASHA